MSFVRGVSGSWVVDGSAVRFDAEWAAASDVVDTQDSPTAAEF